MKYEPNSGVAPTPQPETMVAGDSLNLSEPLTNLPAGATWLQWVRTFRRRDGDRTVVKQYIVTGNPSTLGKITAGATPVGYIVDTPANTRAFLTAGQPSEVLDYDDVVWVHHDGEAAARDRTCRRGETTVLRKVNDSDLLTVAIPGATVGPLDHVVIAPALLGGSESDTAPIAFVLVGYDVDNNVVTGGVRSFASDAPGVLSVVSGTGIGTRQGPGTAHVTGSLDVDGVTRTAVATITLAAASDSGGGGGTTGDVATATLYYEPLVDGDYPRIDLPLGYAYPDGAGNLARNTNQEAAWHTYPVQGNTGTMFNDGQGHWVRGIAPVLGSANTGIFSPGSGTVVTALAAAALPRWARSRSSGGHFERDGTLSHAFTAFATQSTSDYYERRAPLTDAQPLAARLSIRASNLANVGKKVRLRFHEFGDAFRTIDPVGGPLVVTLTAAWQSVSAQFLRPADMADYSALVLTNDDAAEAVSATFPTSYDVDDPCWWFGVVPLRDTKGRLTPLDSRHGLLVESQQQNFVTDSDHLRNYAGGAALPDSANDTPDAREYTTQTKMARAQVPAGTALQIPYTAPNVHTQGPDGTEPPAAWAWAMVYVATRGAGGVLPASVTASIDGAGVGGGLVVTLDPDGDAYADDLGGGRIGRFYRGRATVNTQAQQADGSGAKNLSGLFTITAPAGQALDLDVTRLALVAEQYNESRTIGRHNAAVPMKTETGVASGLSGGTMFGYAENVAFTRTEGWHATRFSLPYNLFDAGAFAIAAGTYLKSDLGQGGPKGSGSWGAQAQIIAQVAGQLGISAWEMSTSGDSPDGGVTVPRPPVNGDANTGGFSFTDRTVLPPDTPCTIAAGWLNRDVQWIALRIGSVPGTFYAKRITDTGEAAMPAHVAAAITNQRGAGFPAGAGAYEATWELSYDEYNVWSDRDLTGHHSGYGSLEACGATYATPEQVFGLIDAGGPAAGGSSGGGTVPPVTLASVTVAPDGASVVQGATRQYTVTGLGSDGGAFALPAGGAWAVAPSGAGAVSAGGLFTAAAGYTGAYAVSYTSTAGSGSKTDSAPGTVTAAVATQHDTFDRADDATALGNGWVALGGVWGISGNQAYMAAATGGGSNAYFAVKDWGVSDGTVGVTVHPVHTSEECRLAFRMSDVNNGFTVVGPGALFRIEGGSYTLIGGSRAMADGDVIDVVLDGPDITVRANGVPYFSTSDAFNQGVTKHGIGAFNFDGFNRWDDFTVTP